MADSFLLQDGIIFWFDGPDWDKVVEDYLNDVKSEVQGYAQENAPWEDRTGAARDGLTTTVQNNDGSVSLELSHTVDYGLWLEVIQNGRFAILLPTLEALGPQISSEVAKRVSEARKGKNYL